MINVTKTDLPDLEVYFELLRDVWESGQITNHGRLVQRLERELATRLGASHVLLTCNGTVALEIAIEALGLRDEVVTTPFSYVATTSSLVWRGATPVFADVEAETLCIDPEQVERALTPRTSGILATHVYGNACDTSRLRAISRRHRLPLIYDAAHAFAAELDDRSLCAFGDISILSLHATKLFHTGEGGALVTDDDDLAERIFHLRNFGHEGQEGFAGLGINGKLSEIHAALGLSLLPCMPQILGRRRDLSALYDELITADTIGRVEWRKGLKRNHAYYPILFETEKSLLRARDALNRRGYFPRRYFYPPLNELPYLEPSSFPTTESASRRVLCLPMGADVSTGAAQEIATILLDSL